jgi:hypothetical protein
MTTTEPRALTAALQSPAFVTRGGGLALHAANRHVERYAPEQGASRSRPLRNLGFVDRLVAPWIESAQRSASLRMFSQYISAGVSERPAPSTASWVFPRPWYQDELDWMAASRAVAGQTAMDQGSAPNLLTTRGTYVAPMPEQAPIALPAQLYEYIAPSLSVARPDVQVSGETYSPLVPFAAANAAHVMARAVAPIVGREARMSPGLRTVLATMLERSASGDASPTRSSLSAPALVTPPAPREAEATPATQVAETYADQYARIAELQRMAHAAAERELAQRAAHTATAGPSDAQLAEIRAAQQRAVEQRQLEIQRRMAESGARRDDVAAQERAAAAAAERQRLEERIAQRIAATRSQDAMRLHEQSREAAARDARSSAAAIASDARPGEHAPPAREDRVAAEIATAVAALPPELASMVTAGISAHPERAAQAIAELGEALRSVELIARNSVAGGTFEPIRGPRVVMPAGLGGLVSTVQHTAGSSGGAMMRMPATFAATTPAPTSAFGAATSAMPAALSHVAWSDRWLARFAGASSRSLEVLAAAASPETRMQILAGAAPHAVFVAPIDDRDASRDDVLPTLRGGVAPAQPVVRFDDDAETPDDVFAAIARSAGRARATAAAPTQPQTPSLPPVDPDRYHARDTLADLVAHAAPGALGAGLSAQLASSPFAAALRHVMPLGNAPSFDVRALFSTGLSATYLAGLLSSSTSEIMVATPSRAALDFEPTYVAPDALQAGELAEQAEHLTTLRSALLSWDVETSATSASAPEHRASAPSLARTMLDSIALPMIGDTAAHYAFGDPQHATTYAAPGMIAERAQAWSVAQERSSSDLAFDFVAPELLLAARVYGLGPVEAAQAMRLAVAGPGQLTAMAGAVDRTFVEAIAIDAQRRSEGARITTAFPVSSARPLASEEAAPRERTDAGATGASFGVERRAPRGAFLFPAATAAALGLNAATPDGEQSMSVAALELLAAQAVAELGTYAALSDVERKVVGADGAREDGAHDEDVLAAASAFVPSARREKFEALYVALSQSSTARTWSPAARAARAFALAGRGEQTISARERATVAWDVLPVVYAVDADAEAASSTGEQAARAVRREAFDPMFVEARPGLANLSARAGEALGSYIATPGPASVSSSSSSSRGEPGAVLRVPTAAPELVQTGRPTARTGGGEVEIPAWFEQAARKMFESKANVSEGISIAELTLVTAAPSAQIAASSRAPAAVAPVAVAPSAAAGADKQQSIDIEKLANDVYREVLVLMDLARARNGEPYL